MAANREEIDLVGVEHRVQRPAHRALLRDDDEVARLPEPLVAPIDSLDVSREVGRVVPGCGPLDGAPFLDDPLEGDLTLFPRPGEEVGDLVRLGLLHRGD
jgi:hypothetical protein